MVIIVKYPIIRIALEIFSMISVQEPNCLRVGMKTVLTGMADVLGYLRYTTILNNNDDFHNNTEFITINGYHPFCCNLQIAIDGHDPQKA